MANYPFMDAERRYYGATSRMRAFVDYIQIEAGKRVRAVNGHWRSGLVSGAAGSSDGYTVTWLVRNYPSAPLGDNGWLDKGEFIRGAPTLTHQVTLRLFGGYGADKAEANLYFPPVNSYVDGKLEEAGSYYSFTLSVMSSFVNADGQQEQYSYHPVSLTLPVTVDGITEDVVTALLDTEQKFKDDMSKVGMTYSDPVNEQPATITIEATRYQSLLREKQDNENSRSQKEVFRQWCIANKGVDTVEAGLRVCTTEELLSWFQKQSQYIGYSYVPNYLGLEMSARILKREKAEAAEREAALRPIDHVDPWGGEADAQ